MWGKPTCWDSAEAAAMRLRDPEYSLHDFHSHVDVTQTIGGICFTSRWNGTECWSFLSVLAFSGDGERDGERDPCVQETTEGWRAWDSKGWIVKKWSQTPRSLHRP